MRDYAQYTSRIPSPSSKRFSPKNNTTGTPTATGTSTATTPTGNKRTNTTPVKSTPTPTKLTYLPGNRNNSPQDKRERESTSTVSSGGTGQRQPPHESPPRSSNSNNNSNTANSGNTSSKLGGASGVGGPKSPSRTSPAMSMTANDALSLRQNGSEATIIKLRQSLDEANQKDATAKAALAKSDAVILELRSSLRNVKRQLETLQEETKEKSQRQKAESSDKVNQLVAQVSDLQHQLAISQSSSKDAKVGELQVQLDRAHAQILTADMVRKELEDTLEAEQYTWELRVQDQERQIAQLQEECDRLQADLTEARSQWKEAEQGWTTQVEDLQQQLTHARTRMAATQAMSMASNPTQENLEAKVAQLQKEQAELQSCLDEALQELEAVDMELQEEGATPATSRSGTSPEVIESLQHLLRWVHQEGPATTPKTTVFHLTRDPKRLISDLRSALEDWVKVLETNANKPTGISASRSMVSTGVKSEVTELQSQVEQYQSELKSREASSAELRESLKEAVALLKPLQDAVSKAEQEKKVLQNQLKEVEVTSAAQQKELSARTKEVERLKADVSQLEAQVKEQTSIATARGSLLAQPGTPSKPSGFGSPPGTPATGADDSLSKIQRAREELRRKRETEGNLQQLLKDAQTRFHSLHEQNESVAAKNRELQGKLQEAETQLETPPRPSQEDHMALLKKQLQDKTNQVKQLQQSLEANGEAKVKELDAQLEAAKKELANREQAEKMLNKSLKDALGLLKPLQLHLEEAEREKMEISRELRNLRKRFRQLQMGELHINGNGGGDDLSRSTFGGTQDISVEFIKIKEELEETVRQLELENSQLQDQLEDLSGAAVGGGNALLEARMRQRLVEANSRYEVTATKLEDSQLENHALVKALKQKEAQEQAQRAEVQQLQEELAKSQNELMSAKKIAKSAIMQMEAMMISNVELASRSQDGTDLSQPYPLSTGSPARF